MQIRDIIINKKVAHGIEITLPNAPMILITARKGYLMCGYLDLKIAEKMGDCAAIIRGIKSIDDLLEGTVIEVTRKALKAGIKPGMIGRKALEKLL
jgi:uncharacterized protein YunC (DUF1805 family)